MGDVAKAFAGDQAPSAQMNPAGHNSFSLAGPQPAQSSSLQGLGRPDRVPRVLTGHADL